MESFRTFMERISSFELPVMSLDKNFMPAKSLHAKTESDGSFKRFYGDTIVFDLEDSEKSLINSTVKVLYDEVPECFCERLDKNTFHMTLHDLSNSSNFNQISRNMQENKFKLESLLESNTIGLHKIKMKSKAIFNMVNTSLVLGLYPESENDYIMLMNLYSIADEIMKLPYTLTPHITLAYYNPDGFGSDSAERLENTVNRLNTENYEFVLNTERLFYQHFTSMNEYENIICLKNGV